MRKIGFVFLFLLLCSMVSADDIIFSKDNYNVGETFQAEIDISVDLVEDLSRNDVKFFDSEGIEISIPFLFFKLLEDKFYIYFNIHPDFNEGNYTLIVENIIYLEENNLIQSELNESFNISSLNHTLYVNPAILIIDQFRAGELFTLDFYNTGTENLEVEVSSSDSEGIVLSNSNFLIESMDSINYDIYIDNLLLDRSEYQTISVSYLNGSYEIPVWFGELESEENQLPVEGDLFFDSPVSEFNMTLFADEDKKGYIEITNSYDFDIYDIALNLTGNLLSIIDLEYVTIESILAGETKKLNINVNENHTIQIGVYSGSLTLDSGSYYDDFPFFVEIINHPLGHIDCRTEGCESGICSVETGLCINETDSYCTMDSCPTGWVCNLTSGLCTVDTPNETEKNDGKIVFMIILIILILFSYLIYKRIKGRPKPTFPLPQSS